jgi:hypothetical protein
MPRNKKLDQMNEAAVEEGRQQSIKDGLSEIYHDDDGDIIDVKKLQIKPERGWQWWLTRILIYAAIIILIAGGVYYWLKGRVDPTAVNFDLNGTKSLTAGGEVDYVIDYRNQDKAALTNVTIKLEWPQNFIFLSSDPALPDGQTEWRLGDLAAGASGQINIKGKIINEVGKSNVAVAEMYYQLAGFSSEYKKVASFDTPVTDTGLETTLVHNNSALVGEAQTIIFQYRLKDSGQINHFWLALEPSDISQVEFIDDSTSSTPGAQLIKPWLWEITNADQTQKELPINFKFIDKTQSEYQFLLKLTTKDFSATSTPAAATSTAATSTSSLTGLNAQTQDYLFYQEPVVYEIVSNDLNLSLIVNGSDQDQGINFGQTLNYSLSYANKGTKAIDNVVVMAVVEGDIIDWSSFKDRFKGQLSDKTITWTKNEVPALASLPPGAKGIIDFSLKVKDFNQVKNAKTFDQQIASYAKFTSQQVAVNANSQSNNDNKSNTITNKLNSDLSLSTSLVYFNSDNIPLGSGPIPFTAGQTTVVRGGWSMFSSLHDLNNIVVSLQLPDYVSWGEKHQASAGDLSYDEASRTIFWRVAQLAAGQDAVTADFDLAVTPTNAQSNQLLVIMPKAQITAMDSVTSSQISQESAVKTSKLEDDPIVNASDIDNNGGLVK